MTVSVLICTYGEQHWAEMATEMALPTAEHQGADDVLTHHEPEGTIATCRNNAAADATSDWLIFLDADDELAPDYVGAMRRALEQHPDPPGDKVLFTPAIQHIRRGIPGLPSFWDRGISLRDDNWLVVGTMIHRDLFHDVGGFGDYPHGFEDWALWSKCFRAGAEIIKVPDAVYCYFHNPKSEHKQRWRDRKGQVALHNRIKAELDAWEAAR